jgi:predicted RecB family nuclease
MPPKKPYLTKSKFLYGLHCPKRLWFSHHDPLPWSEAPPGSPMAVGTTFGIEAQKLFPGGVLVDEKPWEYEAAAARTRDLMADKTVPAIFEAAFDYEDIRIRADVMERRPRNRWRLHEVKSSTSVKEEHIPDVTVQAYVLKGSDVKLEGVGLLHVNNEYVHGGGDIDWTEIATIVDLTDESMDLLPDIPVTADEHLTILRKRKAPEIAPGRHCGNCDYWDRCTEDKPEDWVFYLPRVGTLFDRLTKEGIESIRDIPDDYGLTNKHAVIRGVLISGKEHVSPDLWKAIENFGPPAFYLDFETMGPALPLYAGTRPYQYIPFQWSLHHVDGKSKVTHAEFLADGGDDPRREFTETLIKALRGSDEPIIVYSPYEKTLLTKMAGLFPEHADAIDELIARLRDLLPVTRDHVYHADFRGSFSLKAVAPALFPELDYGELDHVAEGMQAAAAFQAIAEGEITGEEQATLRQALLDYCRLDTLALVEVHRALCMRTT